MAVTLRPVLEREYDAFFAMLAEYMEELDPFDPTAADDPWDSALHREAILEDMEERDLLWIEADGRRAGLAIVRVYPDFPDDSRDIAEIAEFYVLPEARNRGIGSAAIEAILVDHRTRGTHAVNASVLRGNETALRFWERLGFIVRSFDTVRRL